MDQVSFNFLINQNSTLLYLFIKIFFRYLELKLKSSDDLKYFIYLLLE